MVLVWLSGKRPALFPNMDPADVRDAMPAVDDQAGYAGAAFTEAEDGEEWTGMVDWSLVSADGGSSSECPCLPRAES